jgi:hypothetical protein
MNKTTAVLIRWTLAAAWKQRFAIAARNVIRLAMTSRMTR